MNVSKALPMLIRLVLPLVVLCCVSAGAWDGNWTNASSGRGFIFDDPGDSTGQAGTDPPQKFWIPNRRDHADVDPEELHDYFDRSNKDYAPYALARVTQTIHYNNLTIPKGYYLIKPGEETDGSPKVNLNTLEPYASQKAPISREIDEEDDSVETLPPYTTQSEHLPGAVSVNTTSVPRLASRPPELKDNVRFYQTLVILKQGRVMGVVPVHRMEQYRPEKKEKPPRRALAWVAWEEQRPVLKFYYKKWVYTTQFQ